MGTSPLNEFFALELHADEEFAKLPLPHPSRDISLWHIATVFEDSLRLGFVGHVEADLIRTTLYGDLTKYSMRHCVHFAFERCDASYGMTPPKISNPQAYIRASELLHQGIVYSSISRIFTSLHAGTATAVKGQDGYEIDYASFVDARYAVLETLNHGQEPWLDITAQIFAWFRTDELPLALEMIKESTRVKNKFVNYDYGCHAFLLQEKMHQRPLVIPSEWKFPWGSAFETQALINSLIIRCTYHFLAVSLSAMQTRYSGGAESSLVLVIEKDELCRDISLFADFGEEKIGQFLDCLTYGNGTYTPDPALQPLLPTIKGPLLIPCLHIVTSNLQRNVLSLLARIDARRFDEQSRLFEIGMVKSLEEHLGNFALKRLNLKLKLHGQHQEFDVLLADTTSKTALILELRWILRPGDPREIMNKMSECRKKTEKVSKKVAFLKAHLKSVFDIAFPTLGGEVIDDWDVFGAVIIEGFGGTLSELPEIPIVTDSALKIGLSRISNLEKLGIWMRSLSWLPQSGPHFSTEINELNIGGQIVRYPGFSLGDDATTYRKYIEESVASYC